MEGQTTREPVEAQPEEETRVQRRFVRERGAGDEALHARWARQREEFGGVSWSSAFFDSLVSSASPRSWSACSAPRALPSASAT